MSLIYQYLLLITFLFEPYQAFLLTLAKAQPLWVKSPLKHSFYTVKRFYKEQVIPILIFLCASAFLVYQNPIFTIYVFYLLCLPFMIPYTSHYAHIPLLLLIPILSLLFKMHVLVLVFYLLMFVFFYHQPPCKPFFFEQDDKFKVFRFILPPILVVSFLLQNHTNAFLQQILILCIFIMIVNLESCLTETKTLLETSKNRYMLWDLKSPHFDLRFLNGRSRFTLITQSCMILYLSILTGLIVKDGWMILILLLCFAYCLFSEFDKMIHYKFFNQSIFYDDIISRFVFSQIMLSGISFYLIYLGVGQVLLEKHLILKHYDLLKFIFLMWYALWALFFFKRFDKRLKRNILKVSFLLVFFLLTSCTKEPLLTHTLIDERISFTGNMVHQEIQEIILSDDPNMTLKVAHGDTIKKGEPLLVMHYEASSNEIKRINFQIDQLETKKASLSRKLEKEKDEFILSDLKLQIESIVDELNMLQFDKNLIRTSDVITANFSGTIILENNTLEVLSHALVLNLNLNEHEYRSFKEIKTFRLLDLNDDVMGTIKKYDVIFKQDAYSITFEPFDQDCYINQTLIVTPAKPLLFVPQTFIRQQEAQLFAKTDATEVMVEASFDDLKDGYYIHEGLKEGDVVYSYD